MLETRAGRRGTEKCLFSGKPKPATPRSRASVSRSGCARPAPRAASGGGSGYRNPPGACPPLLPPPGQVPSPPEAPAGPRGAGGGGGGGGGGGSAEVGCTAPRPSPALTRPRTAEGSAPRPRAPRRRQPGSRSLGRGLPKCRPPRATPGHRLAAPALLAGSWGSAGVSHP